jgi:hypothetical protein
VVWEDCDAQGAPWPPEWRPCSPLSKNLQLQYPPCALRIKRPAKAKSVTAAAAKTRRAEKRAEEARAVRQEAQRGSCRRGRSGLSVETSGAGQARAEAVTRLRLWSAHGGRRASGAQAEAGTGSQRARTGRLAVDET